MEFIVNDMHDAEPATTDWNARRQFIWKDLTPEDLAPMGVFLATIATVQIEGDFDGARVHIVGAVDNESPPRPLSDYAGVPMVFSLPGIMSSPDVVLYRRPEIIGGTTNTKVTVAILLKR